MTPEMKHREDEANEAIARTLAVTVHASPIQEGVASVPNQTLKV